MKAYQVIDKAVQERGISCAELATYKVIELKGSRAVIGRGGVVTAAINVSNLRLA